jgi:channel protein (hemolysin III family)
VSSLSHLVGAAIAVAGGLPLVRLARGCRHRVLATRVYVTCVVAMLAISGLYHSFERGCSARVVMQRMDYIAIWFLIAGTFTGIHGIMFEGRWRRGVLTFIWGYVAVCVSLQAIWFHVFSGLPGLILYLGLGWVGVVSIVKLGRRLGYRAVRRIWLAGIAYTTGAVLEATGHPVVVHGWVGPHEVFHTAVIIGVALHWSFVRHLLLMNLPVESEPIPLPAVAA